MISCSADDSGEILTIGYRFRVTAKEMDECLVTIRDRFQHLKPGFVLLSDWTNLDSMELACAGSLGELMEVCSTRGMAAVVRVMPDPTKDIGLNLISHFHYRKPVRVHTCANLADGLKCLLAECAAPLSTV